MVVEDDNKMTYKLLVYMHMHIIAMDVSGSKRDIRRWGGRGGGTCDRKIIVPYRKGGPCFFPAKVV